VISATTIIHSLTDIWNIPSIISVTGLNNLLYITIHKYAVCCAEVQKHNSIVCSKSGKPFLCCIRNLTSPFSFSQLLCPSQQHYQFPNILLLSNVVSRVWTRKHVWLHMGVISILSASNMLKVYNAVPRPRLFP